VLEQGFEAIDWDHVIADTMQHMTQLSINGDQGGVVLVEGTMVLNYRLDNNIQLQKPVSRCSVSVLKSF